MGVVSAPPRTTINLDSRDRKELEAVAKVNERSVAGEARIAIRFYLDSLKQPSRGKR